MRALLQPRWGKKGKALKRKTRSNNTNDGKIIMILFGRDTLPSAPAPAGRVVSLLQLSLVHQHIVCCYVSISFIFIFKDSEREGRWLHDLMKFFGNISTLIKNRQICFICCKRMSSLTVPVVLHLYAPNCSASSGKPPASTATVLADWMCQ